jgi:RNA polymerase sigma-70 factor (ECF subfamily)
LNATEQGLLDSIVRGDKSAMRELYIRYLPRLARFLYRVTRDQELIEELANDVMMTVWQRAPGFRRESAVSTWILGIAYRKALDAVRSRKRYDDMISSLPEPSADEGTQHFLAQRELSRMLALLSPEQRAVAELSFDFGYSYPEIAEILAIPVNTVKTRMFYARQTMQACYGSSPEGKS